MSPDQMSPMAECRPNVRMSPPNVAFYNILPQ
jgi:hypothetical protein